GTSRGRGSSCIETSPTTRATSSRRRWRAIPRKCERIFCRSWSMSARVSPCSPASAGTGAHDDRKAAVTSPRALLIVAHPGHELLLHPWLERSRPIVCALTDGSGGCAQDRSGRSRRIIVRTGAEVGPVFAAATDRDWYRAILTGDRRP